MKYLILIELEDYSVYNCGIKKCGGYMSIKVELDGYDNVNDSLLIQRFVKSDNFTSMVEEYTIPIHFESRNGKREFNLSFRNVTKGCLSQFI